MSLYIQNFITYIRNTSVEPDGIPFKENLPSKSVAVPFVEFLI
jgi:hypothetical protein